MRNLVWVALALAVGIGAVLLLSGNEEESGYELEGGAPEDGEDAPGAALEGTGTALDVEVPAERPTGAARLRGIVIGGEMVMKDKMEAFVVRQMSRSMIMNAIAGGQVLKPAKLEKKVKDEIAKIVKGLRRKYG